MPALILLVDCTVIVRSPAPAAVATFAPTFQCTFTVPSKMSLRFSGAAAWSLA